MILVNVLFKDGRKIPMGVGDTMEDVQKMIGYAEKILTTDSIREYEFVEMKREEFLRQEWLKQ